MDDKALRDELERLQLELLRMPTVPAPLQEKRDALAEYIREALEQEDLGGYHASLETMLSEEAVAFEIEHPKIAQLMQGIGNLLSSIGL